MEIKNKIFKRHAERSYPIFAFEANLVLSLSYPCQPLSGWTALEESKTGTTKSLFRFNCACVKCSCLPIGDLGAFSREFFTKPRFICIFVPKQFSFRYLQLKYLVKEGSWNNCRGRPKNQKVSLKRGYKSDPFVHQQL